MKAKKVAIISDLHANINMLNTFLEYIDAEEIELILNLGDYISNGQNPCEVFDKITSDKRFINIKGYDEDSLFHLLRCKEGIAQGEWIRNKLGDIRLNRLEQMPSIKKLYINKRNILMCHINGWADILQLVAHTTKEKLLEIKYDYICLGGSHKPELTYAQQIFISSNIIDPGALRNKDNKGTFVVLDFSYGEPNISFRNITCSKNDIIIENAENNRFTQDEPMNTLSDEELKETLLYIHGGNGRGKMYIDNEVVNSILKIGLKQSKYICIGCWSHEKQVIRELLYHIKCRKIKTSEKGAQEWYIGEITESVEKLVLENRLLPCGRIKWFEISFQDDINSVAPLYSIYHYGRESILKRLSRKELCNMEELLDQYQIPYSLPEIQV